MSEVEGQPSSRLVTGGTGVNNGLINTQRHSSIDSMNTTVGCSLFLFYLCARLVSSKPTKEGLLGEARTKWHSGHT